MPECPDCSQPVDPEWVVCPYCATTLPKTCSSCSRPVEASWSVCPYCATPIDAEGTTDARPAVQQERSAPSSESSLPVSVQEAQPPAAPTADSESLTRLEVSLLVYSRIEYSLTEVRREIVDQLDDETEYAETRRIETTLHRLARDVVQDLNAYGAHLQLPIDLPLSLLEREATQWRTRTERAVEELGRAVDALKDADVPRSTVEGLFQGAKMGAFGEEAATGMAIGMLFTPIGSVVGGMVGGLIASSRRGAEIDALFDQYFGALEALDRELHELELPIYKVVAGSVPHLLPASKLRPALSTIKGLLDQSRELYEAGEPARALDLILSDPVGDGFYAHARLLQVTGFLFSILPVDPDEDDRQDITAALAERVDAYYYHQDVLAALADVFMTLQFPEKAMQLVDAARSRGADGWGIRTTEAQACLALGRPEQAERAARQALTEAEHNVNLWHLLARALHRQNRHEEGAAIIGEALGVQFTGGGFAEVFADEPAGLDLSAPPFSFALEPHERLEDLAAFLFTPDEFCFFGSKPIEDKLANAAERFMPLSAGEAPVVVLDSTVWGSCKNGVGVTTAKVCWCDLWGEPLQVELSEFAGVVAQDEVGDVNLVLGDEVHQLPCPDQHKEALVRFLNIVSRA